MGTRLKRGETIKKRQWGITRGVVGEKEPTSMGKMSSARINVGSGGGTVHKPVSGVGLPEARGVGKQNFRGKG